MTSTEIRDEQFGLLQERLSGDRARVYDAFMAWGPATTRRISALMDLDLLTVRPRTTELLQAGLLVCAGKDGHEGQYRAVRLAEALETAVAAVTGQPRQMVML